MYVLYHFPYSQHARRVVSLVGRFPASLNPSRNDSSGTVSTGSTAKPMSSAGHG